MILVNHLISESSNLIVFSPILHRVVIIFQGLLSAGDEDPVIDLYGLTIASEDKRWKRLHHRKQEAVLPRHCQLDTYLDQQYTTAATPEVH